jgi:hypothetical protein
VRQLRSRAHEAVYISIGGLGAMPRSTGGKLWRSARPGRFVVLRAGSLAPVLSSSVNATPFNIVLLKKTP